VRTAAPLKAGQPGTILFNAEKTPFNGHEYLTACVSFNGWSGENRFVNMRRSAKLGAQVRVRPRRRPVTHLRGV
jgi:hypothetical protein